MDGLDGVDVMVLGLGESGLAMARWCSRFGARVRVWDSRESPPNAAALSEQVPSATWVRGPLCDEAFTGVRLVLKSPGLAMTDDRVRGPLARMAVTGVPVQGELWLFAQALAALKRERGYAPKVLAITGTNGKTTTTSMAAQLIARTGRRVAVAGNIGPTMLQTLMDALDLEPAAAPFAGHPEPLEPVEEAAATEPLAEDDEASTIERRLPPAAPATPVFVHLPEVWVLELSSFQLDRVEGFEPAAATVLNVTQDHLDWHGSMAAYVAAKARVFGPHAVMVINRDDARVEALVPTPEAVKTAKGRRPVTTAREVVRFGLDAPRRPGDFGLVEENGIAWLVRARELDETLKRSRGGKGVAEAAAEAEEIHIQRLMPAEALRVRGRHNAANALAALALATAIGCPLAPMLHGLREYTGEPHRVQFVASVGGIDAYDDSKGTNVGATVAALNGLGMDKSPARLAVILGGDGKGQDFSPLAGPVRRHARAVALIGRDAGVIEEALAATGVPMQRHDSLEAATRWCFERAQPGDAVLLSPACASLDMFRNYGHRAEVFVGVVHALVVAQGGIAA